MKPPRFRNPWPHDRHGILDILRWKLGIAHREIPAIPDAPDVPARRIPLTAPSIAEPPATGWRVTWLGHSSFLLQGAGISLLVDPVFSSHCSPLPLPSLRRLVDPPCRITDLPGIDAVLLSHSHYDHCDLSTLRQLGEATPLFVPSGHRTWLTRHGFRRVHELEWFSSESPFPGISFSAVPAQHFTARTAWDRDQAHWCGWIIEGASCRLWHAGDTASCPAFREIGERYGPLDLGMIPIGAYQPRSIMRAMHMNPAEAVEAFLDAGCRQAIAMHWGTFRLTDEPLGEPPLLLAEALAGRNIADDRFIVACIGESVAVTPTL